MPSAPFTLFSIVRFSTIARPLSPARTVSAVAAEWLLLAAAAPLLLFPRPYTLLGLGLIVVGWLVRRLLTGRWTVSSATHLPILVFLGVLLVSLIPSVRLDHSAPKFWAIVLGVAIFFACLNALRSRRAVHRAGLLFVLAGVAMAIVGLLNMATPGEKVLPLRDLYSALVPGSGPIQTSTMVIPGINPNEVGGTAALFAPVAVALVFARGWTPLVAAPAAAILLGVVLLTQSRSAIVGVVVAILVGVAWVVGRRGGWLLGTGALIGVVALSLAAITVATGHNPLAALVRVMASGAGDGATLSFAGRGELWVRAMTMIVDMPFTGIGLNTFSTIMPEYYPTDRAYFLSLIPHSHNFFLQTAVDFGLVGFAALASVVVIALRGGLAAVRAETEQPLAMGLLLGLLAFGVYGLTDAVALGAKPSPALWAILGLLCALGALRSPGVVDTTTRRPSGLLTRLRQRLAAAPRPAWVVGLAAAVAVLFLMAAPLTVNAARLVLHRPDASQMVAEQSLGTWLEADLAVASRLGWGPYAARAAAAQALLARARGDADGEIAALRAAIAAGAWDPSLATQLGTIYLARGEWEAAAQVWGRGKTVDTLLDVAKASGPSGAADWLALAQSLDPGDWRPYVAASEARLQAQQPAEAAALLATGLRAVERESAGAPDAAGAARLALAARLEDPTTSLPPSGIAAALGEAELLGRAARLLERQGDLPGAVYGARLAAEANPKSAAAWTYLAELWQQLGQSGLADEARRRAQEARP